MIRVILCGLCKYLTFELTISFTIFCIDSDGLSSCKTGNTIAEGVLPVSMKPKLRRSLLCLLMLYAKWQMLSQH